MTIVNNSLPSPESDRRLFSQSISGDRKASESFVRRFSDLVYRSVQNTLLIKQVSFDRRDLEDLHNGVFLQLFENDRKKLRQYQGKNGCSPASWIRLITVRVVLNHLRKRGPDSIVEKKRQVALEDLPELMGDYPEPGTAMERAERNRLLQKGIQSLPPRDRLFLKLLLEKGLSSEKIASLMGISIGNAYTIRHRAVRRLKSEVASVINGRSRRPGSNYRE